MFLRKESSVSSRHYYYVTITLHAIVVENVYIQLFPLISVSLSHSLSHPLSLDPPDVSLSPISLTVNETDTVSFICTVFAIPTAIIHWINDKSSYLPLSVDSNLNVTITNSTKDHPSRFPLYISNLTISSATKQHEGNYTCLAINNVINLINTHENQTASLTVQGK